MADGGQHAEEVSSDLLRGFDCFGPESRRVPIRAGAVFGSASDVWRGTSNCPGRGSSCGGRGVVHWTQ
ncbi:hypothetical protein MPTK1_6g10900 [Marchantia polymorpha subsp. ruderalis]|uniref:Uncharacterized protein n=2 Tax=Marchantia polymorpha TaxID=3197 RepID=A0AAF6BQR2_MARPO|nr:hypothetical protein MARPO_0016s0128 [Marchantia polymorpha]BBN14346.1 hypothetical protein Mp_6g10900 [Marchantia polymorpha subsp. ruderalis]|eukprot:PTQ45078.1 hypothetical protein MARPO_0016s0128 [Marchantia polymorpha]